MRLKSIRDIGNLRGKRVLLRADFNVPLKGKKVADSTRLAATLPTINYLTSAGARVVLISHLGRPEGKKQKALSLEPVAKKLSELLGKKVGFISESVGKKVLTAVNHLKDDQVILLENIRFNKGEEKNDKKFAAELATLGDVYVNDAFAVSHRAHASVEAITKLLPSYAGFLVEKEVEALSKLLENPAKPFVALIGGVKISDKIGVIENLLKLTDTILLGGALASNFLAAQGYKVGKSIVDKKEAALAKKLLKLGGKKLVLPEDITIGDRMDEKAKARVIELKELKKIKDSKFYILDIGPETITKYALIIKKAETIVWNGPMGLFEVKKFSHGTIALGRIIAAHSRGKAFGVVGGGDTLRALDKTGMDNYIDYISTAGTAMLEFLEGKMLPGIKPLVKI